jgi:hypothetical protein
MQNIKINMKILPIFLPHIFRREFHSFLLNKPGNFEFFDNNKINQLT